MVEAEELVEVEGDVDVEEFEEQVLQSESESLLAVGCCMSWDVASSCVCVSLSCVKS